MLPYQQSEQVYIALRISSVLDVTDPYFPVASVRFSNTDLEFEEHDGGHQVYGGVCKISHRPDIFASDRNCGLSVFREFEPDDDDTKVASKDDHNG